MTFTVVVSCAVAAAAAPVQAVYELTAMLCHISDVAEAEQTAAAAKWGSRAAGKGVDNAKWGGGSLAGSAAAGGMTSRMSPVAAGSAAAGPRTPSSTGAGSSSSNGAGAYQVGLSGFL